MAELSPSPARSPLPGLLLLLSATTGLVDAASILGLGKVFTANMTGNIVFLGFAAVGTPGFHGGAYVAALLAFMLGALVAGHVARRFADKAQRGWLSFCALIEAALLWLGALVAFNTPIDHLTAAQTFSIIALTAMAMGFRNATVRQLKVPDLTTTVLTLTITGLAADAGGQNRGRRIAAVLAILGGAALGAWLVRLCGLAGPLALAGALVLGGTLACLPRHEPTPAPTQPACPKRIHGR